MGYLLNVVKDDYSKADHIVAPNRAAAPVKVDFRPLVPYIKDQGQAGSCTAHAATELMELLYRMHPSKLGQTVDVKTLRFSPLFQYWQERKLEGTLASDAGADSRTIFQVLTSTGCCLESEDAYDASNIFSLPTPAQIVEAAKYKVGAYHRILDVDTAKTVLQSGYTFTVGMPLFQQFESDEAASTGMIAMPSGSSIGGHEMHFVGADDALDVLGHIGAFISQNSWADEWGVKGYCYIPYDYLTVTDGDWDMWTAHFGKPWVPKVQHISV